MSARIRDVATGVIFQFCGTFLVWILAEQLHLSGIITLVVFAMAASRRGPAIMPARVRIPTWAVWEVAVFVLNVLAFVLVGFQLKAIAERVTVGTGARYAAVAAAVTAAAIGARIAWVTGAAAVSRWRQGRGSDGTSGTHGAGARNAVGLSARGAAVVGWCGMRGTVTLATALPAAVPERDLMLATAFGVTLGTLVLQGLTLRPLLLRLGLKDDGAVDREVRLAQVETLRAAVAAAEAAPGAGEAAYVRHRLALQLRRAEAGDGGVDDGEGDEAAVVRAAGEAQRRRLVALRADGTIGDAAFQRVEEELDWTELDWTELGWAQVVRSEPAGARAANAGVG